MIIANSTEINFDELISEVRQIYSLFDEVKNTRHASFDLIYKSAFEKERASIGKFSPGLYTYKELLKLSDRKFIYQSYLQILGRPPEGGDDNPNLKRLRAGFSKTEVLVFLRYSEEGRLKRDKSINLKWHLLRYLLGRIPVIGILWRSKNSPNSLSDIT
jgi:hypothetical protein